MVVEKNCSQRTQKQVAMLVVMDRLVVLKVPGQVERKMEKEKLAEWRIRLSWL